MPLPVEVPDLAALAAAILFRLRYSILLAGQQQAAAAVNIPESL